MASPLEQFEIVPLIPLQVAGIDISYTNSALWITIGFVLTLSMFLMGTQRRAMIPGRLQAACELVYDFIGNMVKDNIGSEGRRYFPFVFCLFMMVFLGNLLGLLPFSFTYTSHIVVTGALALVVFFAVLIFGFARHGMHFFSILLPPGVPWWLVPLVLPIELLSFFIRPVTLSVRLFANMLAGHIMLKVFAGFVITFVGIGSFGYVGALLPILFNAGLIGFELLIAFLQAYVFAVLSCIYLKDTLHLEH